MESFNPAPTLPPLPAPYVLGVILEPGREPQIVSPMPLEQLTFLVAHLHTALIVRLAGEKTLESMHVQPATAEDLARLTGEQ